MFEAPCPEPGCKYVAQHHKKNYVNAVLGKHRVKEHGWVSPAAKYYKKRTPSREPEVEAAPQPRQQPIPEVAPNFCPNCGCNLRVITAALNLRRRS